MGKLVDSMYSLFGLQSSSDQVVLTHDPTSARAQPQTKAKDSPSGDGASGVPNTPMSTSAIASATKEADAIIQQLQSEQEAANPTESNKDCLGCRVVSCVTMAGITGLMLHTGFVRKHTKMTYSGRSLVLFKFQCLLLASVFGTLSVARMFNLGPFEERVGKEITYTNLLKEDFSKLLSSIGLKTPAPLQPEYIEQPTDNK